DGRARRGRDDVSQGRVALRPRQAVRTRGQRGEDARGGGRLQRVRRGAPDLRRLRLRQGVPRRAAVAGGPALQDRAGLPADGPQLSRRARAGAAALLLTPIARDCAGSRRLPPGNRTKTLENSPPSWLNPP